MTDNKADEALREVIINFAPEEKYGRPIKEDELIKIDVSDRLEPSRFYFLDSIEANYSNYGSKIQYVSVRELQDFKEKVENILDATIVNAKQRESIQKLLDQAYYNDAKYDVML